MQAKPYASRSLHRAVKPGEGTACDWQGVLPLPIVMSMKDDAGHSMTIEAWSSETCRVIAGRADAGVVVLCDHAGNAFPSEYGTLGLPASELQRHIAYDIGAASVVEELARRLGAAAILSHYSRLLIDLNRGSDDPTLIMRLSDGVVIPGNRRLSEAERQKRISRYWQPYHAAVDRVIDQCIAAGSPPSLISVHSFTESWKGVPRPWHTGVLWDKDPRLVDPLLVALRGEADLIVGDNQPYTGQLIGDSMWRHGTERGLAHAIVEIRQDLIREQEGQTNWAERLARLIRPMLADHVLRGRLNRIEQHGSNAGRKLRLSEASNIQAGKT
jgi:predicted N-formylglutamate amidohydrolase